MRKQYCGGCKFFKLGDPAPKRYGNIGVCTFMLGDKENEYASKVPFWSQRTAHRVVSWEGEHCKTFEPRRGKRDTGTSKDGSIAYRAADR